MDHRPVRADRENDYVLMELGRTLGTALDRADESEAGPDLFDAAMRHVPTLLRVLGDGGFVLGKGEAKVFRGQRRRKIRATTWRHLGNLARQLDMSRPQLLRALLRLELGLSRPLDMGGEK